MASTVNFFSTVHCAFSALKTSTRISIWWILIPFRLLKENQFATHRMKRIISSYPFCPTSSTKSSLTCKWYKLLKLVVEVHFHWNDCVADYAWSQPSITLPFCRPPAASQAGDTVHCLHSGLCQPAPSSLCSSLTSFTSGSLRSPLISMLLKLVGSFWPCVASLHSIQVGWMLPPWSAVLSSPDLTLQVFSQPPGPLCFCVGASSFTDPSLFHYLLWFY